jgi:hypothetical protein
MAKVTVNELLNRVMAMHERSLPMYLAYAAPFVGHGDEAASEVLSQIVTDHKYLAAKIGDFLVEHNHAVGHGHWDMNFTSLHDVSLHYLLGEVIRGEKTLIADLMKYADKLGNVPAAKALVQEALGMAKGHLESLEELTHGAAAGT